jgi:hypothetical protein
MPLAYSLNAVKGDPVFRSPPKQVNELGCPRSREECPTLGNKTEGPGKKIIA